MKRMPFNLPHLDAAENIFFQRELETILAEQFNVVYATLKGRLNVPNGPFGVDTWAETFTYDQYDSVGKAARVADYADDLPMVDVLGKQYTNKIAAYGEAFGYSIPELQASAAHGKPLDRTKALAARDVAEQSLDDIAFQGDSGIGTKGISNQSGASTLTAGVKVSSSAVGDSGAHTGWLDSSGNLVATADEMLLDLHTLYMKPIQVSKDVEKPTRMLLPTAQFFAAVQKPRSSTSNTSVLEYFRGTHDNVAVDYWERLKGASPDSASLDLAIAYDPNPRKIRLVIPQDFMQMAPQLRNMKYVVNCYLRSGGVVSPYPLSMAYMKNI